MTRLIILLILLRVLSFLATTSKRLKDRNWLDVGSVIVAIILFTIAVSYDRSSEFDLGDTFPYGLAIGLIGPRLVANIINPNRLESPVIFLKGESKLLLWILSSIFWLYMSVMVFQPNPTRLSDGAPVYDDDFVWSRMGFLLLLIPTVIFFIIQMLQRTAFCQNGLFHNGLLWDWSGFRCYSWKNEALYQDAEINPLLSKEILVEIVLEPERNLFTKTVQFLVPHSNKAVIEDLLRTKVTKVIS